MSSVLYALATATTSMGGFAMPPKIWMKAASNPLINALATFILIWQSKHVPLIPAIILTILFFAIIVLIKDCEELSEQIGGTKEEYSNPRYFRGAQKVAF